MSYYYQGNNYTTSSSVYWTPGVKILIIANAIVFALQVILYSIESRNSGTWTPFSHFIQYFALDTSKVIPKLWLWQLLSYSFLHSITDIFHLLFNLLTLFFFGHIVEERYGTKRFLAFYLVCAVFAAGVYVSLQFLYPGRSIMLGASGAIMGVLVLAACILPDVTVLFYFIFPMKLRTLIWILVGMDIYMVLIPHGGVAASAHLGGAFFGYLCYLFSGRFHRYYMQWKRKIALEYQKEKEKSSYNMREEIDRILDKIHQNGIQSLTAKEKEFLQNASKKYKSNS